MTKKLVINGTGAPELVEMTADEEAQRNSENSGEAKQIAFENKMSKLATDQKAGYDKLIELGSGNSTLFFSKLFNKIESYETDKNFYNILKEKVSNNVDLKLVNTNYI